MHLVQYLQAFSGLCWASVAVCTSPSVWRGLVGQARQLDAIYSVFFFMGFLQAGFVLRWLLFPHSIAGMDSVELQFWTALYALCGTLGLWVIKVSWAYRGRNR